MDTVLKNETYEIFKTEIQALYRQEGKYITLSPAELEAIVNAFEFTLTNGGEKVRAQMIYDLIQVKREN